RRAEAHGRARLTACWRNARRRHPLNRAGGDKSTMQVDPPPADRTPEMMGGRAFVEEDPIETAPRRHGGQRLARTWRSVARLVRDPAAEGIGAHGIRVAELGPAAYPRDVRRRLLILRLFASLVASTTAGYALQHIQLAFETYKPLVYINLALLVMALTVR